MSVSYGGDSITFGDGSIVASGSQGFKNKIINGHMMIDQRQAGSNVAASSVSNGGYHTVDRWAASTTQSSKFTLQQVADAPTGFKYSVKLTSVSSYSAISSDYFGVMQLVEGYNIIDLDYGLSTAKTTSLSFWVKSSISGTFGGCVYNGNGSTRSYPFSYTISSGEVNTWKNITVNNILGDTSVGPTSTTSGIGMYVYFSFGAGSSFVASTGTWQTGTYLGATGQTNHVATNGSTLQITGVQWEKGTTASSFEFRSYGKELMLCQRYYQLYTATSVEWIYNEDATTNHKWWQCYLTGATMRTAPSATFIGSWTGGTSGGLTGTISSMSVVEVSLNRLVVRVAMSADGGTAHLVYHTDGWSTKQIGFSAEL